MQAQPRDQCPADVPLAAVLVRYWQHHGRTRFSPDAIRRVLAAVPTLMPGIAVAAFTIPRQEEFVAGLGVSAGSARRYMGVIAAALSWAYRRQEIASIPPILRIEATDGEGARPFTVEELRRLFAAARSEHERRFLLLAVATGARPQAILELDWSRVHAGVADLNVPGRRRTKKRRTRAALPPAAAAWLEGRRSVGPVIQYAGKALKSHRMTFQRLAMRAGLSATAYGVRKAVATWLRQAGVPEWEVGAQLGHRVSSAMTERYAHHRPDYMAATRRALQALLVEIRAPWLATAYPAVEQRIAQVIDGNGRREWDRTTDHFHVKDTRVAVIQPLNAANDD